jgi:hypothetical protein
MENEDLYRNFVTLLKLFKNRPYHLAKYLIQNGAIKEEFLSKIINSDRLRNIKEGEFDEKIFMDINQMNDFFNSLTIEVKKLSMFKTDDEINISSRTIRSHQKIRKIEKLIKLYLIFTTQWRFQFQKTVQ